MEKTEKIIVIISILVFVALAGFYMMNQAKGPTEEAEGTDNETQPGENVSYVSMKEVIAAEKGVKEENLRICFSGLGPKENVLATGVIVRGGGALALLYDNENNSIVEVENEFYPKKKAGFEALSELTGRLSPWTGEEIVPILLSKADNSFHFKYYDGYSTGTDRWEYGYASLHLENNKISWEQHVL